VPNPAPNPSRRRRRRPLPWCLLLAAATAFAPAASRAAEDLVTRGVHAAANRELDQDPNRIKGRRALQDALPEVAERFFRECLAAAGTREPQRTDATILLLQAQLRQGRAEAALQTLAEHDRITATLPPPARADADWADKLAYWHAIALLGKGDWTAARGILQPLAAKAAARDLRELALEALGDACARQGDWPAAEHAYRRHLNEFPRSRRRLRLSQNLVKCAIGTGNLDKAEKELEALAKLAPAASELPRLLLLLARNDLPAAWTLHQATAARPGGTQEPDFWLASRQLADALTHAGRFADAQTVLGQAQAAAPTPADLRQTRLAIAELWVRLDQPPQAIQALEQFRRDFPDAPEMAAATLRLGSLLRESRNYLLAAERYGELAASLHVPRATRYAAALQQAACLRAADQFAAAGKACLAAAELGATPAEKAEALFLAGDAAFAAGNYAPAATWYAAVRATDPGGNWAEKSLFNQALARAREGRAAEAATLFANFGETYPQSPAAPQARLQLGIALRQAGQATAAIRTFEALAADLPTHELAPQALLEAAPAAVAAGQIPLALTLLERLRQQFPSAPQAPRALYQQAHLLFLSGHPAEATAACNRFLDLYPRAPLAADLLVWLGDDELSQHRPEAAEKRYLELAARFPASPLAPQALLDAARSAFLRRDLERTGRLLDQLAKDYAASLAPAQTAQAALLTGDLLAEKGDYAAAIPHFRRATESAPADSDLGFTARGRQGDMHLALAGTDTAADNGQLAQAIAGYRALLDAPQLPAHLQDMTRYRLAKALEKAGQTEAALKELLAVFYQYDLDALAGHHPDWTWFVRGGTDAARLLLLSERPDNLLVAARIYERIAAAGIPESAAAAAKARELRTAHGLDK
jgi:outer membrane protein assembly factor BamD (BamD/ComL family)